MKGPNDSSTALAVKATHKGGNPRKAAPAAMTANPTIEKEATYSGKLAAAVPPNHDSV